MTMTMDVNKINRLMGLTIMQASKNFKSNRLLRIFGSSSSILNTFVKYMNQLGMSGYSISARNYPYGYSGGKELQGSRHKYSKNNEYFGASCNKKNNWGLSKNDKCMYLLIGIFRVGNCKSNGQSRKSIGK